MKYLGQLVVPASTSKNNSTTATPFAIPAGVKALYVQPTGADLHIEVTADPDGTYTTNATKGFALTVSGTAIPVACPMFNALIAAYNAGGSDESLKVWALWSA